MSTPDFLYIGAPRAGSTWLWTNMKTHPEIWVPPCKSTAFHHTRFQIYRLKKLTIQGFGKNMFTATDHKTRSWYRRFFLSPFPGDKWYAGLFPDDQISGDINEAYCSLEEKQVQHIARIMPDVKLIFTMRDPVERALSHAVLGKARRKNISTENVPDDVIKSHLDHPSNEARTRYSKTLDLWQTYFPKEQFHIGFYEQLSEDAEKYFKDICVFLGVGFDKSWFQDTLKTRVNPAGLDGLSDEIKRYTARKYYDELKTLSQRYGSYATQWKEKWTDFNPV